jgi:hypothetical protein
MPQKSRSQKERAAARRESGQLKSPVRPAPIEVQAPESASGYDIAVPSKPVRRLSVSATQAQSFTGEFDYSYVYADLRRIGILAVLCFGIMIVLAFLLR